VETLFWKGQLPGAAATDACIPLAPGLMDSALVLMYHPGFTVSSADERSTGWNGGITAGAGKACPKTLDAGRLEMLRLVLISCSQTLFVTPDEYKSTENKWLSYYTTRSPAQAQLLLQSLCAVIFQYDPVGMGIPYASAMGPDRKESVVDLAVQILIVLLDYLIPGKGAAPTATNRSIATEQVLHLVKLATHKP
jgi:hypothetical protein